MVGEVQEAWGLDHPSGVGDRSWVHPLEDGEHHREVAYRDQVQGPEVRGEQEPDHSKEGVP